MSTLSRSNGASLHLYEETKNGLGALSITNTFATAYTANSSPLLPAGGLIVREEGQYSTFNAQNYTFNAQKEPWVLNSSQKGDRLVMKLIDKFPDFFSTTPDGPITPARLSNSAGLLLAASSTFSVLQSNFLQELEETQLGRKIAARYRDILTVADRVFKICSLSYGFYTLYHCVSQNSTISRPISNPEVAFIYPKGNYERILPIFYLAASRLGMFLLSTKHLEYPEITESNQEIEQRQENIHDNLKVGIVRVIHDLSKFDMLLNMISVPLSFSLVDRAIVHPFFGLFNIAASIYQIGTQLITQKNISIQFRALGPIPNIETPSSEPELSVFDAATNNWIKKPAKILDTRLDVNITAKKVKKAAEDCCLICRGSDMDLYSICINSNHTICIPCISFEAQRLAKYTLGSIEVQSYAFRIAGDRYRDFSELRFKLPSNITMKCPFQCKIHPTLIGANALVKVDTNLPSARLYLVPLRLYN